MPDRRTIRVGNVWSFMEERQHWLELDGWCAVHPNGYWFSPKYKRGLWDGYIHFARNGRFPTGLLEWIEKKASRSGIEITVSDERGNPPKWTPIGLVGVTLRDYQEEAVSAVLDTNFLGIPWPRGIIHMATASGKTNVLAALAGGYGQVRVVILVHRQELLYQTAKVLAEVLGEDVGVIGDGRAVVERVTVGMVQTLIDYLDEPFLQEVGVLLIDECHRLNAMTHLKVVQAIPAYVRVGVSGTPFKSNDLAQKLRVLGTCGDVLYQKRADELVNEGFIAPVTIQYATVMTPNAERLSWPDAYERCIVDSEERNACIQQFVDESLEPTLVIVSRLLHGELLARRLECTFVSGAESSDFRQRVIQEMSAGMRRVLVASTIFDEGLDVPNVSRLVLAAGGKSEIQLLQRIGRGMRVSTGKERLEVLDFLDLGNRYTAKHSRERIETAAQAGFTVEER